MLKSNYVIISIYPIKAETMNEQTAQLDAEELLHFAIQASQNKENEKAVLYLKQAIFQQPENARLHYLLGAQHADIGMYDQAIEDLSKAVELNPELETAHFQLGLLYASSARIAEAEKAWQPLEDLDEANPLLLFKTGLLQLANDQFKDAKINLQKGIEQNNSNPGLNTDMQNILDQVNQISSDIAAEPTSKSTDKSDENTQAISGNHIFLSAYSKRGEQE